MWSLGESRSARTRTAFRFRLPVSAPPRHLGVFKGRFPLARMQSRNAETAVNPAVIPPTSKKKPNGAAKKNGAVNGNAEHDIDAHELLNALQSMLAGDFSVRIRGSQIGLAGKIADTFNEIAA